MTLFTIPFHAYDRTFHDDYVSWTLDSGHVFSLYLELFWTSRSLFNYILREQLITRTRYVLRAVLRNMRDITK